MKKPVLIISAPSGAGKNTLIDSLLKKRNDLRYSVSSTTRPPRGTEQDGVHYYFLSSQEFEKKIERHEFLEWAQVLQNYYGTEKREIEKIQKQGNFPILDIDVQGALQLKEKFPKQVITIFILPPSLQVLRQRLQKRATDSPADIEKRIALAQEEIKQKDLYDFCVVNDELTAAVNKLNDIINSLQKNSF